MFEHVNENVVSGFSTRADGNLALHVEDLPADVIANRTRLANRLGFHFDNWTCADQVHGAEVAVVNKQQIGAGRTRLNDLFAGYDGLVTNLPGVLLTSFYADCVPLYFFDPSKNVIGLAHAGWKGTVANIAANMITVMRNTYECEVEDIYTSIGPSIGSCCYEVDDRVINGINEVLGVRYFPPGKAMLDLKDINRQIMIKAGILPTHISISDDCTSCRTDLYYSHRAEQGRTGRMASWIGLKSEA